MPSFCTSCGTGLLKSVTFCTSCGTVAPQAMVNSLVADSDNDKDKDMKLSDTPPGFSFPMALEHKIATGAVVIAVLAGFGLAAIDYAPRWRTTGKQPIAVLPTVPSTSRVVGPVTKQPHAVQPAPRAQAQASSAEAVPSVTATSSKADPHRAKTAKDGNRTKKPRWIVSAQAAVAMKPPSIDDQYNTAVRLECSRGIVGLLCRESLRWRFCDGRWHDGHRRGETRCYVARAGEDIR